MNDAALHSSGLNMLFRCGIQFEKRYIDGIRCAPGVAMKVGTAVHAYREVDLTRKLETGQALTTDEVVDVAATEFERTWNDESVELDSEEKSRGIATVAGEAKDLSIKLSRLHSRHITPVLSVKYVERPIRVSIPGLKFDYEGTIDTGTTDGVIHDCKTSGKGMSVDDVSDSLQLAMYDLLVTVADKKRPTGVAHDLVQKVKDPEAYEKKYKKPAARVIRADVPDTHDGILQRLLRAEKIIESGLFTPVSSDHWVCSNEWCGYALTDQCAFGPKRRRKSISMSTNEEG